MTAFLLALLVVQQPSPGLVNLGRLANARVSASSVNGSRPLDNQFYGVRNLFDGGSHWMYLFTGFVRRHALGWGLGLA